MVAVSNIVTTLDALEQLPWLLPDHRVVELLGYASYTLSKMVDCGVLAAVKPMGCDHRRFRKVQVALLLNAGELVPPLVLVPRPLLLSEKTVMEVTGYGRNTLRNILAAGGLRAVRPAGLSNVRYLRHEIIELLTGRV